MKKQTLLLFYHISRAFLIASTIVIVMTIPMLPEHLYFAVFNLCLFYLVNAVVGIAGILSYKAGHTRFFWGWPAIQLYMIVIMIVYAKTLKPICLLAPVLGTAILLFGIYEDVKKLLLEDDNKI